MPTLNDTMAFEKTKTVNITTQYSQSCPGGPLGSCPITKYKIEKVIKQSANIRVPEETWGKLFRLDEKEGTFTITNFTTTYNTLSVYI